MAICAGSSLQLSFIAVLVLPLVLAAVSQAPALSPEERAIAAYIDAHNDEAIALLERVVNINSGTMNLAGVRDVGSVFQSELDRLGFKTTWVDQSSVQRAGHLIADHAGAGPRLLLIGHLDTVFEKSSPFQRFERLGPDAARGPGIIDMKGGDVIMLQALKALDAAGLLKSMNVTVALMGDEEEAGRPRSRAREALVNAAKGAAAAIGFENGDGDAGHAIVARRGTASWDLRVTAKSGHSSQIFSADLGPGAVFEAARILDAFRNRLAAEPHLTFNPGVIAGGASVDLDAAASTATATGKTNVVPASARVIGDLRALSVEQFAAAKAAMQEIVARSLPGTTATIEFDDGYPPLAPSEGNERLLAMFDRASRDLGYPPVTAVSPDRAGAADVSFVAGHVPMVLDAIGMKGRDDHSPSETADLKALPMQAKRAALLLHRLAKTLK